MGGVVDFCASFASKGEQRAQLGEGRDAVPAALLEDLPGMQQANGADALASGRTER